MKYLLTSLFIFLVFLATWTSFLYLPTVKEPHGVIYAVHAGESMKTVTEDLYKLNVVPHPFFFKLLAKFRHDTYKLKAGEYLFPKGSTPSSILKQIVTGTGLAYYPFMIVPGWTFNQLINALNQQIKIKHTLTNLTNQEIMKKLGLPHLNPEGQFFADTYYYTAGSLDISLLKRAFHKMQQELAVAWEQRVDNSFFKNSYQALIAASLVEKEAYLKQERPIIAGVLVNRLKKDMLLQFDPTIIYGLGPRYTGKLSKEDLAINTPFNTYLHHGLPPTPIAIPSLEAIQAVLRPTQHSYYYFVAKGDGSHRFSQNLAQHYQAVQDAKKFHQIISLPPVESTQR